MSTVYKCHIGKKAKKHVKFNSKHIKNNGYDAENEDVSKEADDLSGFKKIRQKVLVLSSRGITFR